MNNIDKSNESENIDTTKTQGLQSSQDVSESESVPYMFETLYDSPSEDVKIDKTDILAFIIALAEVILPVLFGFVAVAAIIIYLISKFMS